MDENRVEIMVSSRNKTKEGFKAAEADAEASGARIAKIFGKIGSDIHAKLGKSLANLGGNLGKGGGIFALGSSALGLSAPLAAAGVAVAAFSAIAVPELAKV